MCSRSACRKARPRPSRNSRRPDASALRLTTVARPGTELWSEPLKVTAARVRRHGAKRGRMKAALLGAFAILLAGIGTAPTARALPAAPLAEAAATGHTALPIRHHRHHGRWRHWSYRYPPYSEPEAASPTTTPEATPAPPYRGAERGSAQPVVPPAHTQSSRDTTSRAARGSGSSRPAIRWVDPDRPAR